MRRSLLLCLGVSALLSCACSSSSEPAPFPPPLGDATVTALADAYLAGWFERNPDQITYFGVPGRAHDRLPDNSPAAEKAWEVKEDNWRAQIAAVDPRDIRTPGLRATYAILRETLEGSTAARPCRSELWNVSQMTGWQVNFGYLVTIQPVGNPEARAQALARWQQLPAYLDAEIANLREGLRQHYSAPKLNVRIVIGQVAALISAPAATSPFTSPAQRDSDAAFKTAFTALYTEKIRPAFVRYHDFLEREYLPAAREEIPVAANPDGAACYAASIRLFSTRQLTPDKVHQTGLEEMARLTAEMSAIGTRRFGTSDIPKLMRMAREDPRYRFRNRADLIAYSQAALKRAQAAAPAWFGLLPKATVTIEPYPPYREKNAANEYNPPAEDGSRPGLFLINAYQAERRSRVAAESTAFHETVPGHHLQIAIALERREGHPIGRYINNSGYAEGWGLYAERLADEMQLYSSDLDRLGMLSSQAFRAARLVVDTGLHTKGWSRQQAIDYMLAHTAEEPGDIASEVDRYIIMPGQATAYMLGRLAIDEAREHARQRRGASFDIKAFHDRVLEDGAVPVSFLTSKIDAWSASRP